MLYTRKGDGGTSGLFGTCERFSKREPVYDALGTLDELVSLLGLCRAYARAHPCVRTYLQSAQECLFIVQAELAGAKKSLTKKQVWTIEETIGQIEEKTGNPHSFIIPGETELSGWLDYARAVARRVERTVLNVADTHAVGNETCSYLNRLSSLLYALARYVAVREHVKERAPSY